ncbi:MULTISPECIES: hypothetical protein [Streptomyces]|uniref:Uncharacterized protein n=1 Tax=Streptomyces dengpaensis TaxID=2049881 RepID=A0ABN5I5C6_9ACTN|nr:MULTISPECIES: hypothetical protein [Streptomyces]AVH58244.1 hypothetical protein C4B68_23535 [Streptomyces dengpaensis]PIB08070.1 hypothetical protein B1C81_16810 [Streptomyces sp. HG99]
MPAVTSSQSAYAALRFGRIAAMSAVAALILIAGVWASWDTAQHVMLSKGREQGTITVKACSGERCTGPYTPVSVGSTARARVTIESSVAVKKGGTYTVTVKPGSSKVVRSGPAGLLYAWVPLGGALLLTSVVVAGGLRLTRAAWVMAGVGIAQLTATFLVL